MYLLGRGIKAEHKFLDNNTQFKLIKQHMKEQQKNEVIPQWIDE